MTVTYSRRVADAGLGTFFHLLLRWKGSIYKLLYRELIIFTVLYYFFSTIYRYRLILLPILFCWFQNEDSSTVSVTRFILKDDQKRLFEKLSIYCDRYAELIPVSFVLGQLVLKYHFFFFYPSQRCTCEFTLFEIFTQVSMWPWLCHAGGASLKTSPGQTAWQH